MIENPKQAISNILFGLDNLSLSHDENISVYDTGSTARLQHYKERREIRQNSKLKLMGIPTPIRSINKAGFGIMPGEICSLFARTGVGKSWFCIKAAALCTHLGYKTLFFSPEMPAQQMDLRLDVVLAQIKGYQFSHYDLRVGNPIDEEQYEEFLKKANEKALLVCDHVDKSAIDLAGIAAMVRKHRPEVLIIDNMELLLGSIQGEAVWERMHSLYSGIKTLCTAFKVSAFVTHQAKQKGDVFRPPGLSEVAFGEALIRASDTAMSMSLVQDDDKKRMISFQKFRDVANKMPEYIYIDFDVDCGLFKESDA
jgi:replicative DNA helicase